MGLGIKLGEMDRVGNRDSPPGQANCTHIAGGIKICRITVVHSGPAGIRDIAMNKVRRFACLLHMELIFVYNAGSGILNMLKDAVHKLVRPESYPCSLCALTYGAVSEKSVWRRFCRNDGRNMRFLHKDEFESEFDERFDYPVVLERTAGTDGSQNLSVVLASEALDGLGDVDEPICQLTFQGA